MKYVLFVAIAITAALLLLSARTMAEEQQPADSENTIPVFYWGAPFAFINTSQFDDELRDVGLHGLRLSPGMRMGFGFERPPHNPHFYSFRVDANWLSASTSENHRFAELSLYEVFLHGGYRYRPISWFSLRADLGIGLDRWRFEIISPELSGRATGFTVPLQPELGFTFHLPYWIFINLYGGYQFNIYSFSRRFAGAWTDDTFDSPNLDHATVGLEFGFRFQ